MSKAMAQETEASQSMICNVIYFFYPTGLQGRHWAKTKPPHSVSQNFSLGGVAVECFYSFMVKNRSFQDHTWAENTDPTY